MAGKHRIQKSSKIRNLIKYWTTEEAPGSAKPKSTVKFRRHCICITLGIGLAIMSSYMDGFFFHLAPALPILANLPQEIIDRIRDL